MRFAWTSLCREILQAMVLRCPHRPGLAMPTGALAIGLSHDRLSALARSTK